VRCRVTLPLQRRSPEARLHQRTGSNRAMGSCRARLRVAPRRQDYLAPYPYSLLHPNHTSSSGGTPGQGGGSPPLKGWSKRKKISYTGHPPAPASGSRTTKCDAGVPRDVRSARAIASPVGGRRDTDWICTFTPRCFRQRTMSNMVVRPSASVCSSDLSDSNESKGRLNFRSTIPTQYAPQSRVIATESAVGSVVPSPVAGVASNAKHNRRRATG